ncbi:MAG: hypothetical protein JJU30_04475 [Alkalimonas sp.]|uniref:Uncharacterized protein n=1 Tax=Alkalimonas delamerensis TaxID=265981 RepID=A0ABT9GLI1_9GAMM|nr:hypothetical protein [Alkalimonas delamerensis]MCC5852065.1 hypothetical protein [Alkalimonas sp.]MDP4527821.1 hypothetical protein [Alkalimonas delamerensis]
MIRLIFLLPLLMFAAWFWFLQTQGLSLKQGQKGFIYIAVFNLVIGALLAGIIWLTQR